MGLIGANLETDSRAIVRFYNNRGTAEQWSKEGKQAVKMTRLSCHRFRSNVVRLLLSLIGYNLGNLWRRLVLPKKIDHSVKIGGPLPGADRAISGQKGGRAGEVLKSC